MRTTQQQINDLIDSIALAHTDALLLATDHTMADNQRAEYWELFSQLDRIQQQLTEGGQ